MAADARSGSSRQPAREAPVVRPQQGAQRGVLDRRRQRLVEDPEHLLRRDAVRDHARHEGAGAGADVDVELVDRAVDGEQVERTQRAHLVDAAGEPAAAEDERSLVAPAAALLLPLLPRGLPSGPSSWTTFPMRTRDYDKTGWSASRAPQPRRVAPVSPTTHGDRDAQRGACTLALLSAALVAVPARRAGGREAARTRRSGRRSPTARPPPDGLCLASKLSAGLSKLFRRVAARAAPSSVDASNHQVLFSRKARRAADPGVELEALHHRDGPRALRAARTGSRPPPGRPTTSATE